MNNIGNLGEPPSSSRIKNLVSGRVLKNANYMWTGDKFELVTDNEDFYNQFDSDYTHFKNNKGKFQNFPIINEFANLRIMTYNIWFD
jgi:hypothetical protein